MRKCENAAPSGLLPVVVSKLIRFAAAEYFQQCRVSLLRPTFGLSLS